MANEGVFTLLHFCTPVEILDGKSTMLNSNGMQRVWVFYAGVMDCKGWFSAKLVSRCYKSLAGSPSVMSCCLTMLGRLMKDTWLLAAEDG